MNPKEITEFGEDVTKAGEIISEVGRLVTFFGELIEGSIDFEAIQRQKQKRALKKKKFWMGLTHSEKRRLNDL